MRLFLSITGGFVLLLAGFAAWLGLTPWGAKAVVRELARRTLGVHSVSWAALEGSLIGGIQVDQFEVRVIPYLPGSSFLRIQSLAVRCTRLSTDGLDVGVINARLFHPGDDPVVFNARFQGNVISGNLYTRSLDLGNVRGVLTKFFDVAPFKGSLRDIDLVVSGRLDRPAVNGHFTIERILQNGFTLQEARARTGLYFVRGSSRWETHGKLFLDSGYLRSAAVRIKLSPSVLTFTGQPSRPELDIRATSRIARTRIDISVKGTRQSPALTLSSDPVYPKEQLLLMLATGKRWSGVEEGALDKAGSSSVLAANFVDYLLFGGDRARIIRALGLSDISFNADDQKQGVTISKNLTDRLGIGYGVEVGTNAGRQRELTQRLEGEYQLTDHFLLGVQKEVAPGRAGGAAGGAAGAGNDTAADPGAGRRLSPEGLTDDKIFLRYRSSF